jgi:hypothetical protein
VCSGEDGEVGRAPDRAGTHLFASEEGPSRPMRMASEGDRVRAELSCTWLIAPIDELPSSCAILAGAGAGDGGWTSPRTGIWQLSALGARSAILASRK